MDYRLITWPGDVTVADLHWMAACLSPDIVVHVTQVPALDPVQRVLLDECLTIAMVAGTSANVKPFALVGRNQQGVLRAARDYIDTLGGTNIRANRRTLRSGRKPALLH